MWELISPSSSKINLSQSSKPYNVDLEQTRVSPTETPLLAQDSNALTTAKLELAIPGTLDLSKRQYTMTVTSQSSSPQEKDEGLSLQNRSEESALDKPASVTPDSQDSPDKLTVMSSDSMPTSPGSGSPKLDQLLSDLKEMKLKFRQETHDKPLSPDRESPDNNPEVDEMYEFQEHSKRDQWSEDSDTEGVSIYLAEGNTNDAVPPNMTKTSEASFDINKDSFVSSAETLLVPKSPGSLSEEIEPPSKNSVNVQKSPSEADAPEKNLTNICGENFMSDIPVDHEGHGSTTPSNELKGVIRQTSTQSIQDKYLCHGASVETISSQSLSDLTPETVTTCRHFSFDELIPDPSSGNFQISSDQSSLRTCEQQSEEALIPIGHDCSASQSASVQSKTDLASSASDEEYSIPLGYVDTPSVYDISTHTSPECVTVVQHGAESPTFESSDPEPYFDCKQGVSDFSETEHDRLEARAKSSGTQAQDQCGHLGEQEMTKQKVLLSSGSEDYEDAPFVHKPPHHGDKESEESLHSSETSDEEFTFCEASQLPGTFDTSKSLRREITAELGSISESSDEEFLTTRIIRRRVVIQADEMADLPSQSVTEERYKDENGHIVIKKVTRKVIRKCVSADGVEHEEVPPEGAPQGSVPVPEGDGYSKVVKRTVVKSEGDHTEVTFVEHEGFHSSRQDGAEACKVSHSEKTTLLEGERTITSKGDPSLASDLPSAQDDFKQALGFFGGFSRTELPPVVERETVREDGTVVRRAHMRKSRTLRRTVVKGAGQNQQVLVEQTDNSRKGTKRCDL